MNNWGLIGFDIALLIIGVVLVPTGIKTVSVLNDILNNMRDFTKSLSNVCETMKDISNQLKDAHIRDVNLKNEIRNIKMHLGMAVPEDE